jgi:uncharacterized protein Usg
MLHLSTSAAERAWQHDVCKKVRKERLAMVSEDFRKQMQGFGLTTANILYRMPDHPGLLQSFIWQNHDLHPAFPELRKFLDFWRRELEGALHSVQVSHCGLIKPAEFVAVGQEFYLH